MGSSSLGRIKSPDRRAIFDRNRNSLSSNSEANEEPQGEPVGDFEGERREVEISSSMASISV